MKLVIFTRYDKMGASSRVRSYNFDSYFKTHFDEVEFSPLIQQSQLKKLYVNESYSPFVLFYAYLSRFIKLIFLKKNTAILIEKELFPGWPYWVESLLLSGKKFCLDYDDSIFHNYDQSRYALVRYIFGKKIDKLMKKADLVMCGSHYIKERALSAGAVNPILIPTVVSIERYDKVETKRNKTPIIVWIGTPKTVKYLEIISTPLQLLAQKYNYTLRIIGSKDFTIEGVNIEYQDWSEDSEVNSIATADIGIMPLENTAWEMGKCGYKLIQYMACALPVVGSDFGENKYIIRNENGFAASTNEDWYHSLSTLLVDGELRKKMGANGRMRVEVDYSEEKTGPQIVTLLNQVYSSNTYHN